MNKKTPKNTAVSKKSMKQVVSTKQRGRATRSGWVEVKNDNPNGREDFDDLLAKMLNIKPHK